MKLLVASVLASLILSTVSIRAASDADVTLLRVEKVRIEGNVITIVAEASTRITLIRADYDPAYQGDTWLGRPVSRIQVKSDKATFTIKRPPHDALEKAWQMSLKAARDLQEGKEVGRIGYYAPDMVIKENLIESITGPGFLYPKGQ